jgi:hypothetical protein
MRTIGFADEPLAGLERIETLPEVALGRLYARLEWSLPSIQWAHT